MIPRWGNAWGRVEGRGRLWRIWGDEGEEGEERVVVWKGEVGEIRWHCCLKLILD